MNVIRKGLRLRESTGEEERRVIPAANVRTGPGLVRSLQSSSSPLEPETTIKNKLISAWNNVKYGKKAWATSEIFKTGFSKNSPVWLMGQV